MNTHQFFDELHQCIAKYDLLCHPFYRAWSAGELTRDTLREYAADYYHHVAAFPTYLSALHCRLPDGETRRALLGNLCDEEIGGVPHSELWLDFAEGMGNQRDRVRLGKPSEPVRDLIDTFRSLVSCGSLPGAFAALFAYESQVPRIAKLKARALGEQYGADAKTCRYFVLHETADIQHAQVWREQLAQLLQLAPDIANEALLSGEQAAQALWKALDSRISTLIQ